MADDGLIAAYLRELAYSVAALSDGDDIVAEAEDHLNEASDRLVAQGRERHVAEAEAVARFGSAALISRVCVVESKRGASVPTNQTKMAGLAGFLAPVMLMLGQWGNVTIDEGAGHGVAVFLLAASLPAFIYELWGLRTRHGGLGRVGRTAFILAVASPVLSLAAGWGALAALVVLLSVAVAAFGIEMLRASVLAVVPLALVTAGSLALVGLAITALGVTIAGGDAGHQPFTSIAVAFSAVVAVGFSWLGFCLWHETAVDASPGRGTLAGA